MTKVFQPRGKTMVKGKSCNYRFPCRPEGEGMEERHDGFLNPFADQ